MPARGSGHAQRRGVGVSTLRSPPNAGMCGPQPDQLHEATHHRALERRRDLDARVVVAVDGPTLAGPLDAVCSLLPASRPDVVDLRDAPREQLDGPRREIPLVVLAERRVVGAVELVDVDAVGVRRRTGCG